MSNIQVGDAVVDALGKHATVAKIIDHQAVSYLMVKYFNDFPYVLIPEKSVRRILVPHEGLYRDGEEIKSKTEVVAVNKIGRGYIVQLNSGGPHMTVEAESPRPGERECVCCIWFDDKESLVRAMFDPKTLTVIKASVEDKS